MPQLSMAQNMLKSTILSKYKLSRCPRSYFINKLNRKTQNKDNKLIKFLKAI